MCRAKLELDKAKGKTRMIIEEAFDSRTLAKMNVAPDSLCETVANGELHAAGKCVAKRIIKCASNGKTTLGELIAAGQRSPMAKPRTS
jgi:hypothetical protein